MRFCVRGGRTEECSSETRIVTWSSILSTSGVLRCAAFDEIVLARFSEVHMYPAAREFFIDNLLVRIC